MQTFLPYADFFISLHCLDNKRLGKQRVEAYQILRTIKEGRKGWSNHPAVLQWTAWPEALAFYGYEACRVWKSRGFKDSLASKFVEHLPWGDLKYPPWLDAEEYHASHRSNLLRKDKEYYSRYGWTESDNLPYVWPIRRVKVL
jgi:hypothetical protein